MKDDISHDGILLNLILPLQNHPETMSNIGLIKMEFLSYSGVANYFLKGKGI